MGCISSKEQGQSDAKAARVDANGNGHAPPVKPEPEQKETQPAPVAAAAPAVVTPAPDAAPAASSAPAAPAAPTPQPLYTGPDNPPGPASPAAQGPSHHGPPKRERSELKKRQGTEYEEDSDWDQCSTANFNVDEETQPKDCEVPVVGASVMEKALHNSLFAQEKHVPGPDNEYK
ncbi:hypothetical protein HYH03_002690 [Edaphochlamys debaryana]|uniref:Uncharacterized protein n=1 Tax=Edaphochlamys debaryana TaxID=47281 RepID=A0A836C3S1_9CHLO|nr:hypothetical protein HYH03_002690 [Edaphochlamys debaryana]|eukprot:KAG2499105.1 hypothetical protein HYH03_002690 [Edaphochlamys debaryana]